MVKRAKSPDLPDDAKYLVIHQPYPLNANFELPGDYIAFAFWAATVIGRTTEVWGIHHKPKVGLGSPVHSFFQPPSCRPRRAHR